MGFEKILDFEKILNYEFKNKRLLAQAFMHSSFINERKAWVPKDNERLEFLGDAVIELMVSSLLFAKFPDMGEGDLTRFRAKIVCEKTLATAARQLKLGEFLAIGRGEELTGGRNRDSILADVFEALAGALYLDAGIEKAHEFVVDALGEVIDETRHNFHVLDYKTRLQEVIQKRSKTPIKYTVLSETGPDHQKTFVVSVSHDEKILGKGKGKSKKLAEQGAARAALKIVTE